jgi:hypothetical protein
MQANDITQGWKQISSEVDALKTYRELLVDKKRLRKKSANSAAESAAKVSEQLNKISEQQKRFQKSIPTSTDNLLNLFGQINGNGSETIKFLRQKCLQTVTKIGPQVLEIIKEESIKAIGCSQEQTFKGVSPSQMEQIGSINALPQQEGIYLPLQSLDFFGNLKNSPFSFVGKSWYEKDTPSVSPDFRPFGGLEPYPMNREFYLRLESRNVDRSFNQEYGKFYKGVSGQDLFDFQYTQNNSFNIPGDYLRIILLDRKSADGTVTGSTANKVGQFISDYFATINLVDSVDITRQLVNVMTGGLSFKAGMGSDDIQNQSKFDLLVQRILGLCQDNRTEIDVSGIAKIGELDGVDETFFEFNEVDLRNIEIQVSNIQNGVMEFTDCENVKLPVDADLLVKELDEFRDKIGTMTTEQQVAEMEKILDSIVDNPDWKLTLPSNFNAAVSFNKNVIKQLPLAVVAAFLTPKVMFPILTMLSVVQSGATYTANQFITSANTFIASANTAITSANTINNQASNVINNQVDFLNKFRSFNFEVIARVGEIFLKTLFDLIKRDLINLIGIIVGEIGKGKYKKYVRSVTRLAQFLTILAQLAQNLRNCRSLVNDILQILKLINGLPIIRQKIPLSLLLMSDFLPGYSAERGTINAIANLQFLGIPTGPRPNGQPNLMNQMIDAVLNGADKEMSQNGVSDISVGIPTIGKINIPNMPR